MGGGEIGDGRSGVRLRISFADTPRVLSLYYVNVHEACTREEEVNLACNCSSEHHAL